MKKKIEPTAKSKEKPTYPVSGMQFYAVVYLYDGTVHAWPGKDKPDCQSKINDMLASKKWGPMIRGYSTMKRNLDHYKDGMFL